MEVEVVLLEVSSMNFILGISKEMKWNVKMVLLEVSSTNFILWISKEIKWNGEKGVTRSMIDELNSYSWDVKGDQMEG